MMEKVYSTALSKLPGVAKVVKRHGEVPLKDYVRNFFVQGEAHSPIQPRDDFTAYMAGYAARLLGPRIGERLGRRLEETPVIQTANHHGVDYKAQTVQGTILFALRSLLEPDAEAVVPVLACGLVPMRSFTNPRGIILSREAPARSSGGAERMSPVKVQVFPYKYSSMQVSACAAYDRPMVEKAMAECEALFASGGLLRSERESILAILGQDYLADGVLELQNYSDQATVVNNRLWKRLFSPDMREDLPELVYLELERVVGALLEKDLGDEHSLISALLFTPAAREEVLRVLHGHVGCWDLDKLRMVLSHDYCWKDGTEILKGCGTAFFWGVTSKGRRVPMYFEEKGGEVFLSGSNCSGDRMALPLTPKALAEGLRQKRLLPNLFTTFVTLVFSRGVKCYGGNFQVDYLPLMQWGLARALFASGLKDLAGKVIFLETENYVTGQTAILAGYPDGRAAPAGAVEIMAGGGLSRSDLERMGALTVEEANIAGCLEMYAEVVSEKRRMPGWFDILGQGVRESFGGRLAEMRLA